MESTNIFSRIKSKILPINSQLLKLKLCYFLLYAVGSAQMPYVSIILTRIVNYQQLSILYICVTVVSTVGQIILGFVADKLGIYKATIILGSCVGCFINLLMIWLESEHKSYTTGFNETIHLAMGEPNQTNYPTDIDGGDGGGWIFPVLLIVRVLGFLGMDAAFTLLDSFGMATTEKYGGDFGKQRMWAMFANIIVPTLCGLVVDAVSYSLGQPNYWSALLFATGFAVFFILTISKMEIKVQRNKESMLKTTKKMIGMLDVDIFVLVQILVGSCTGFHMMFLSIYVDAELIASKTLFGLASSCSGVSAAIASSVTKPIIDRFGEANTVAFSLVVYSIRFVIYNYLQNPWILIITESFDGLTGLLSYSTGCYFCAAAAPPGMLASLNGILAAAFYGIGRTLGAAVGSFLISSHGIRLTYLYFGILAGSTAILYMIAYHLLLKKMEQTRLTCSAQSDQGWAEAAKLNQDYKSNDLATTEF